MPFTHWPAAGAAHSKLRYTEGVGYGVLLLVFQLLVAEAAPCSSHITVECSRELRGKRGADGRDQHGLGSLNVVNTHASFFIMKYFWPSSKKEVP